MGKIHKEIIVSGLVQGVSFRVYTCKQATRLGITGTVKNLNDGSVAIVAEGEPIAMEEFVAWCRRGPAMASVEQLQEQEGPVQGYDDFTIVK